MHVVKSAYNSLKKGETIELVNGDYVKVSPNGRREIIIAGKYKKSVEEVLGLKVETKAESKAKTESKKTTSKKAASKK